jgi:HTH-type transcriptional regulator / antitoxin HigA
MTNTTHPFNPDWVSPPGDTIADLLEERDLTQAQLAEQLDRTAAQIQQLLDGELAIDESTARKLAEILGSTEEFWLKSERLYRSRLAKLAAEKQQLLQWFDWLNRLPVKDLMKQGAIWKRRIDEKNKPDIVRDCLRFFRVASPAEWEDRCRGMQAAFRRTRAQQSDEGAISAWLRLGEIAAADIHPPNYDRVKFERAVREIRKLTILPPAEFMPKIERLCFEAGVVFVLVPSIPKAHTSGVARWLTDDKPLIQLSLYGRTNDRFWFTFFHEVAHILLHSKEEIFLDECDGSEVLAPVREQEAQADLWSREWLIPPEYVVELNGLRRSKQEVQKFADRLSIHPAIVVGRLQHEKKIRIDSMNGFKEKLTVDRDLNPDDRAFMEFDRVLSYVMDKNQELYKQLS